MKKSLKITLIAIVAVLVIAFAIYFVAPGLAKTSTACPLDYTVSEDGSKMTIRVFNTSSVGYFREPKIRVENGTAYLDFYGAFGGIDGTIGAMKDWSFEMDLDGVDNIVFNRSNGYETVYTKTADGDWVRAN